MRSTLLYTILSVDTGLFAGVSNSLGRRLLRLACNAALYCGVPDVGLALNGVFLAGCDSIVSSQIRCFNNDFISVLHFS